MANKRFIDFPIATTVGDNDIILIWQGGANKQTTKATILSGVPDSLNDLTDVTISGLTNGQILRYDSVTGQWENTDQGNLDLNDLNDVTIVSPTNGQVLVYNSSTGKWENSSGGYVPYVGAVTTVNLGAQSIQAGSFVKQSGTSSQFLKADGSVDSTAYGTGSVTSVGLTMPAAFNVANSPITTSGTLAVTGAGTVAQYIRGDGSLADFPESSGGGSSVSYYLNGSVDQGTIGGIAYKELSKVPILGAGTDFTINADGYIASFITDAGDPNLLEIPGGNWNFETYFSASSSGGTPTFYVELYKVSGTTATLIASSSSAPELIAFGTNLNPYFSTLAVPTTTLALTDRLAVRYYVTHSGRTITLHTENNHLCQIITTFTTGLTALNGLTAQVQNFAVGTIGTDFNIASATATHTFNLPTASATNRGALSSADWALFTQAYNDKINSAAVTGTTTKTLTLTQQDGGTITASWSDLNTDAVLSVFGRTGNVVAANGDYTTAQVTESGNLYYTDARSRAALSFAAGSGAYNTSTGVITIPTNNNQIANGAGYITSAALAGYLPLSGGVMTGPITTPNGTFGIVIGDDSRLADRNIANTLFLEGVQNNDRGYINFSQTSGNALGAINGGDLTWRGSTVWTSGNITPVTSVTASSPLASSGGTTPNITIQQASGSQNGFLSSTDWTTFNNKQNALTNPVTGTGVSGRVAIWNGSSTITSDGDLLFSGTELNVSGIKIDGSSVPYIVSTLAGNDLNIQFPVGQGLAINNNGAENIARIIKNNFSLIGASTIQTSTGNLTISTGGGNGNIILSPNGSGNVGIGVTPSAWTINSKAIQLPQFVSLSNQSNGSLNLMSFALETSSNAFTYADTGVYPLRYNQNPNNGAHSWYVAGTGTAGNAISFTQAMTLDSIGRLGIGTPSPSARLHVFRSTGGVSAFFQSTATNGEAQIDLEGRNSSGTARSATFKYDNSDIFRIGTSSNIAMRFETNDAEAMRIFSSRNVHIGSTPASDNGARLQVSGTAMVTDSVNLATTSGNVGVFTTTPDIFGRFDDKNLGVSVASATQNLALQLNAGGSAGRGAQIYMGQGGTRHFTISSNASESRAGTVTNTPFILTTNETTRLTIAASTGAATFSSSVTAGGDIISTSGAMEIQGSANAVKTLYINRYGVTSGSQHRLRAANAYFEIASANSEPIVLTGGNVLIGTQTDNSNKLRVEGQVFINANTQLDSKTTTGVGSSNVQIANFSNTEGSTYYITATDGTNYYRAILLGVQNSITVVNSITFGTIPSRSFVILSNTLNMLFTSGTWTVKCTQIRTV